MEDLVGGLASGNALFLDMGLKGYSIAYYILLLYSMLHAALLACWEKYCEGGNIG
jgi:hypothetical protein